MPVVRCRRLRYYGYHWFNRWVVVGTTETISPCLSSGSCRDDMDGNHAGQAVRPLCVAPAIPWMTVGQ
jgi:hypothetical protein